MPITDRIEEGGYLALPAREVLESLSKQALSEIPEISRSFERLVRDRQMGDNGKYRNRRFSRLVLNHDAAGPTFEHLGDRTIFQSLEDNALNGGVARTYEPLEEVVLQSALLRELLLHDSRLGKLYDPRMFESPVAVGIHQVRITALPESEGLPTPEGVHRDAERFTFQHFWSRENVKGGDFVAYDTLKKPVFTWLQEERLDSVLFTGTTWHSATPILCRSGAESGHRDIFLIDFDALPGVAT